MCTHLHVDHVGWNTKLENGQWVPTFSNARYLFGRKEFEFISRLIEAPDAEWDRGYYNDSILPVVEADQMDLVDDGYSLGDRLTLELSPGHTPGHMTIRADGKGQTGLFVGDALHHPLQIHYPEVISRFCTDPVSAVATRRRYLSECADHGHVLLPAHFGPPHFGRISRNGDAFRFHPGLE
jgi:glyoxylase-like metal-dependent hydrolase (beta-lactamase superfamily II)